MSAKSFKTRILPHCLTDDQKTVLHNKIKPNPATSFDRFICLIQACSNGEMSMVITLGHTQNRKRKTYAREWNAGWCYITGLIARANVISYHFTICLELFSEPPKDQKNFRLNFHWSSAIYHSVQGPLCACSEWSDWADQAFCVKKRGVFLP